MLKLIPFFLFCVASAFANDPGGYQNFPHPDAIPLVLRTGGSEVIELINTKYTDKNPILTCEDLFQGTPEHIKGICKSKSQLDFKVFWNVEVNGSLAALIWIMEDEYSYLTVIKQDPFSYYNFTTHPSHSRFLTSSRFKFSWGNGHRGFFEDSFYRKVFVKVADDKLESIFADNLLEDFLARYDVVEIGRVHLSWTLDSGFLAWKANVRKSHEKWTCLYGLINFSTVASGVYSLGGECEIDT